MKRILSKTQSRIRGLLIEDDPFQAKLMQKVAEGLGAQLDWVTSAQEGVAQFKRGAPRFVVVDLNLGEGPSGLDAVRALRQLDPQKTPILVASGTGDRTDVESLMRLGILDFLVKPFDGLTLAWKLRKVIHACRKAVWARSYSEIEDRTCEVALHSEWGIQHAWGGTLTSLGSLGGNRVAFPVKWRPHASEPWEPADWSAARNGGEFLRLEKPLHRQELPRIAIEGSVLIAVRDPELRKEVKDSISLNFPHWVHLDPPENKSIAEVFGAMAADPLMVVWDVRSLLAAEKTGVPWKSFPSLLIGTSRNDQDERSRSQWIREQGVSDCLELDQLDSLAWRMAMLVGITPSSMFKESGQQSSAGEVMWSNEMVELTEAYAVIRSPIALSSGQTVDIHFQGSLFRGEVKATSKETRGTSVNFLTHVVWGPDSLVAQRARGFLLQNSSRVGFVLKGFRGGLEENRESPDK